MVLRTKCPKCGAVDSFKLDGIHKSFRKGQQISTQNYQCRECGRKLLGSAIGKYQIQVREDAHTAEAGKVVDIKAVAVVEKPERRKSKPKHNLACPKCGGVPMWHTGESFGNRERFRCSKCGHRTVKPNIIGGDS